MNFCFFSHLSIQIYYKNSSACVLRPADSASMHKARGPLPEVYSLFGVLELWLCLLHSVQVQILWKADLLLVFQSYILGSSAPRQCAYLLPRFPFSAFTPVVPLDDLPPQSGLCMALVSHPPLPKPFLHHLPSACALGPTWNHSSSVVKGMVSVLVPLLSGQVTLSKWLHISRSVLSPTKREWYKPTF